MRSDRDTRVVPAVHARRTVSPDPHFEAGFAEHLRAMEPPALADLYARFAGGESAFDETMRRIVLRAMTRAFGDGVRVGRGVLCRHAETFAIGTGVFLGDHAVLQGRFDGTCAI